MLTRVLGFVRAHDLWRRGNGVLIACSGGPDSMAMLDLLSRLGPRAGLRLRVAYVHHGLRAEADGEAKFVEAQARCRDLPFHLVRVRVPSEASLQQAARGVRLAALRRLAERFHLERIALGHTRSDQAETVLLRVLRGTGPRGLAGIPARRDRLIRPLLCVGRDEVEAYLRRRAVPSVQDASNRDRRFARVRVRLDVLPLLRTLNPRVEEALARLADNARAEAGGFASPPLTRGHLGALANLLARGGGTSWLSLPGDRRAEVRIVSGRAPVGLPPIDLEIPGFGRHPVPEAAATVSLRPDRRRPRGGEAGWFDARALAFPLRLRTRRAGDRIALPGGTKKVSDLLIDAKVPRRDRDRTLLLCDAARVLWVAGVRQAAGTWPSGSVGVEARLRVVEAPGRKIGARR